MISLCYILVLNATVSNAIIENKSKGGAIAVTTPERCSRLTKTGIGA
jgi:hypothetical protein